MERLEGLDAEIEKEESEKESKITSMEEVKRKRKPFHFWEVNGTDHKMKLTTGMITKLENKYRTNLMSLVLDSGMPPLSVMLTVAQAAIAPWEHGTTYDRVAGMYDSWLEDGGSQMEFYSKIILPTMAVSGFFTAAQAESILKDLEEAESLM